MNTIATSSMPNDRPPAEPTSPTAVAHVFGHSVVRWHDRFWDVRRCGVVRNGQSEPIARRGLYLLLPPCSLLMIPLEPVHELLSWVRPRLLTIRLTRSITPSAGNPLSRHDRCYWTPDRRLATTWARSGAGPEARLALRRAVPSSRRWARRLPGKLYNITDGRAASAWLGELVQLHPDPSALLPGAHHPAADIWRAPDACIAPEARLGGTLWIGAGRTIEAGQRLQGPRVLPDQIGNPALSQGIKD